MSEFDEYIVHGEPEQKEKADAWQTAIGLQNADGLKASDYSEYKIRNLNCTIDRIEKGIIGKNVRRNGWREIT